MHSWIKPNGNATLRDHKDNYRIVDGPKKVKRDATWIKRIKQGDAVECQDPSAAKKAKPKPTTQPVDSRPESKNKESKS